MYDPHKKQTKNYYMHYCDVWSRKEDLCHAKQLLWCWLHLALALHCSWYDTSVKHLWSPVHACTMHSHTYTHSAHTHSHRPCFACACAMNSIWISNSLSAFHNDRLFWFRSIVGCPKSKCVLINVSVLTPYVHLSNSRCISLHTVVTNTRTVSYERKEGRKEGRKCFI